MIARICCILHIAHGDQQWWGRHFIIHTFRSRWSHFGHIRCIGQIQYCHNPPHTYYHNSTLEHLRQRRVNRLELTSSNQEEGLICGSITSQSTPLTTETHTHKQKHTEVNTNTLTQHHLHIRWTHHIFYSVHFCLHAVKQTVKLLTQRNILT